MKWLFALLVLSACAAGTHVLTMESFSDIPVGSTESEVLAVAGKPYAIHHKQGGVMEYEYIERLNAGSRSFEERHYYFVIQDGKVTAKHYKQLTPPGYGFDSYEMQTTQHLSPSE